MRGLVLMELLLALLVLMFAAGLVSLLVQRGLQHARLAQFESDLKQFATIFSDHRRQQGAWPPSTRADAVVPRGMESALGATRWSERSPLGGSYGWVAPTGPGRPGAIELTAFSPSLPLKLTRAEMLEVDRRIDDGNLATGRFRAGFNGWPVFLVEFTR